MKISKILANQKRLRFAADAFKSTVNQLSTCFYSWMLNLRKTFFYEMLELLSKLGLVSKIYVWPILVYNTYIKLDE